MTQEQTRIVKQFTREILNKAEATEMLLVSGMTMEEVQDAINGGAKKDRMKLRELQAHDAANDDCVVRELEMEADMALTSPGYSMQFWRDVQLYGVREAILYVRNGKHGNADAIKTKWDEIKERIQ